MKSKQFILKERALVVKQKRKMTGIPTRKNLVISILNGEIQLEKFAPEEVRTTVRAINPIEKIDFFERNKNSERFYDQTSLNESVEDDMISGEEEGFMLGYLDA